MAGKRRVSGSGSSLLERYVGRLGLESTAEELKRRAVGPVEQIIGLLDEILRAHTKTICFENIDVAAQRARSEAAVRIDLEGVAAKLLDAQRGGYCHEHAVLIRGALNELGLMTHPILARIHLGDTRTVPGGLTHQASIVTVAGRRLLVDPGFGSGTPEATLELSATATVRTTAWGQYRLVPAETCLEPVMRAESQWVFQSRTDTDQAFRNVYAFAGVGREQADLELSNWYTSTKPGSRFTGPPILARSLPGGGRITLEGDRLRHLPGGADAHRRERTLRGSEDFAEVLAGEFGLAIDRTTTDFIWAAVG